MSGYLHWNEPPNTPVGKILAVLTSCGNGYHHTMDWTDDTHGDSCVDRIEQVVRGVTKELQFAPLGDNHHNAAACPHCNPRLQNPRVTAEGVRTALHLQTGYLISEEAMPSIVRAVS